MDGDRPLVVLARDLSRRRTRARCLWQIYQAIDEAVDSTTSVKVHQAWSDAVDEALEIAEKTTAFSMIPPDASCDDSAAI
jgi:tetraacyldisaccharide-1-P 4'-kinase